MASVPNMRAAPLPIPPGQASGAKAPPDFVCLVAPPTEELNVATTPLLPAIESGDAPASDSTADGIETEDAQAADPSTEAAQLAALAPLLQSLPAVIAAPAVPAPPAAAASKVETSVATSAPARALETPSPAPALLPAPKSAAMAPAGEPAAEPAQAPVKPGKAGKVRPEAQTAEAETDSVPAEAEPQPTRSLEASAREAVSAAKRAIEAALRAAPPALANAAPKAAQVVSAALQAIGNALPDMPGADPKPAADDLVSAANLTMQTAPSPAPAAAGQARETAPSAAAAQRTLDIANDAEWIDRLARDIAQASGNEGTIRFKLHPQTLGSLRVELSQGEHGTSVRLTADTEHARSILADAQPRLVAEARAQGVRIAETHVDLSGSDRNASGDPRRQDDRGHNPIIRTARDAAAGADAPERPGRSRSDRYA